MQELEFKNNMKRLRTIQLRLRIKEGKADLKEN